MENVLKKIADAIVGTEFENKTFAVGGYVRDLLMKRQTEDLDIVVNLKNGGIKLAKFLFEKGISSKPVVYENFGTAMVKIAGYQIEFVMTRRESYRDKNRKPEVEFGTLEEDVFRRDFTINSLLLNISANEILDLTGKGKSDIQNGIIRSTSDPKIIFGEDPLRMLRAVRFAVQLDFEIEKETQKGIIENASKLQFISAERKRDELVKILLSPRPAKGIKILDELHLLKFLIPEMENLKGLEQGKYHYLDAFEHTLLVLENTPPKVILRLSALLHDIGKPQTMISDEKGVHFYNHEIVGADLAAKIMRRLKFSGEQIKRVKILIKNHMRLKNFGKFGEKASDKALRKLWRDLGENLELLLELIHADNLVHAPDFAMPEQIPNIRKRLQKVTNNNKLPKLPLNGKDIMLYLRISQNPEVGRLKKKAEEIWLEHPDWGKEKILNQLKEEVKMEKQESKIAKKVHDAVVKAIHTGEDVGKAVKNVVTEIISTSKDEELNTKEKVSKLANEALQGAKEGYTKAQPSLEEFLKKTSKNISETLKTNLPKVTQFTKEFFEGLVEGAKDVIEEKKEAKKEEDKSEE